MKSPQLGRFGQSLLDTHTLVRRNATVEVGADQFFRKIAIHIVKAVHPGGKTGVMRKCTGMALGPSATAVSVRVVVAAKTGCCILPRTSTNLEIRTQPILGKFPGDCVSEVLAAISEGAASIIFQDLVSVKQFASTIVPPVKDPAWLANPPVIKWVRSALLGPGHAAPIDPAPARSSNGLGGSLPVF